MGDTPTLKNLTSGDFGKPPAEQNQLLKELGKPHIDSFNYMINSGLDCAIANLHPVEFELPGKDRICLKIVEASIGYPAVPLGVIGVKNQNIYPTECKQRRGTYRGTMRIRVSWSINGRLQPAFDKDMGNVPIMIKSNRCHLADMTPAQLVAHEEHEQEWGGYFVIKGLERLVRMLLMTRRNYPMTIKRSTWKSRGKLFSEYGVQIRCVQEDQTSTNNVLHFVTDGSVKMMFGFRKMLYYAPLILIMKCLGNYCDYYIYSKLLEGCEDDLYYTECILNMLRALHVEGLHTHQECKEYIGKMFRVKLYECPEWYTDSQVADFIIQHCILIHLDRPSHKFDLLVIMTKKLFSFAQDKCKLEGADAVMMQELLLGGHLYQKILKEKLQVWLFTLRQVILKKAGSNVHYSLGEKEITAAARSAGSFENSMEMVLATGSLASSTGLGLMQDKGLTIVPENINRMRYMSHFKAVHRGAFFQEMRTTEARQLLPDAWGFICPVHTPDGAPCGLLNHLTMKCTVTDMPDKELVENIPSVLFSLGMVPYDDVETSPLDAKDLKDCYVTMLDGRVLGYVPKEKAGELVKTFRALKIAGEMVPDTTEIVLVPMKNTKSQYPGLFLFTGPARLMRPLTNLLNGRIELVGTFEQVYLDVCVKPEEYYEGVTTHMELSQTAFLSNLAQLIPMPDCNQSPRNMYQCQMGKQTMGTPCHTWNIQAETKLYRLQTPASPLFRPVHYDKIGLDDFAMGTNAIVAVISYTGYDMEDAIVINKCSEERGLCHGSIYKSEFVQLDQPNSYFCRDPAKADLVDKLDTDGLPYIGRKITDGEPLYCFYNADESCYSVKKFMSKENCYVNSVRLCGDFNVKKPRVVCLTYRVPRNPSVGDKFASRAGQKGICSQKWPAEDLPFTETGLVPDIVFNPHGFPSRMTIAMMIEIMAGKSAAVHGLVHDATPFVFDEKDTAIDYFGKLLEHGGYNYYGTETMFSGIDGKEMEAQIFFGVVHYQRLRHMVSDKWQVRSTGPQDILTRQPMKGRKRGGGVRFGEMERDSLISHGCSFLLHDRLMHCSDLTPVFVCTQCETLLGPITVVTRMGDTRDMTETREHCRLCGTGDGVVQIHVPYVFKLFVTELASVNINLKIKCKESY